jgi:hypothetical protein
MLALALLSVLSAHATPDTSPGPNPEAIALTVAEIGRLLNSLVIGAQLPATHSLHWSNWRRKVQARARRSHYQRRLTHNSTPQTK